MTWALYDVLGFTATGIDNTDQAPMGMSTMVTNTIAAAHTVDLDGSVDATTSTPQAETATLWAVTMELPAAAATTFRRTLLGVGP